MHIRTSHYDANPRVLVRRPLLRHLTTLASNGGSPSQVEELGLVHHKTVHMCGCSADLVGVGSAHGEVVRLKTAELVEAVLGFGDRSDGAVNDQLTEKLEGEERVLPLHPPAVPNPFPYHRHNVNEHGGAFAAILDDGRRGAPNGRLVAAVGRECHGLPADGDVPVGEVLAGIRRLGHLLHGAPDIHGGEAHPQHAQVV